MYKYEFDKETGGVILTDDIQIFSKEPRPVYAKEMDFLGMDNYWKYDKQQEVPYMWAESNAYWYRGVMVAKAIGGSLYEAPNLLLSQQDVISSKCENTKIQVLKTGEILTPVNIEQMIEKNKDILDVITQMTVKLIYQYYNKQKNKIDCFHVAFSGGKDSIVLLNLVKKALPQNTFIVVFGDTGMEFPDTYSVINKIENDCNKEGIEFYRANSHLKPLESWKMFGPPSRVLRWCCSVHKSSPQTLKLREVLGKDNFIGADFVGVRRDESFKRSGYDYENFSKKQKGQYSQNPILDWNSAEIWLYLFTHKLPINEAYKKGNSRAGCLLCPMGGGKGDFFQYMCYSDEIDKYVESINFTNARDAGNTEALKTYVTNGGWNARKNGRDLTISELRYSEEVEEGQIKITIKKPLSNWKEWIKTIDTNGIIYNVQMNNDGYVVTVSENSFTKNPANKKKFKQVFKKAAHCINCKACESHCSHSCLSFKNGLEIKDCKMCGQCHEIESGCLAYHSLKLPTGKGVSRKMKSVNAFGSHPPKNEWVFDFLEKGSDFWDNNNLGGPQEKMFKLFLLESGMISNDTNRTPTVLFDIIKQSPYDGNYWGLVLCNFAYNSQFMWFVKNLEINQEYSREIVNDMLINEGLSNASANAVSRSWKFFCDLPFGTELDFGCYGLKGKQVSTITRTKTKVTDNRVILYSLYKFAEACGGYYQFTLTRLLKQEIESIGISPSDIFGLDRVDMEAFLNGLTVQYSDFINATFTHDLEKISLSSEKNSNDILNLFKE